MLELASLGAQVLHNRSVEMAKRYNVNLEVLSSFTGNPGTKVKEVVKNMEKSHVSGVAKDKNVARLALVGLADEPGIAFKIFSLLAKNRINVDIILQSIGRDSARISASPWPGATLTGAKALLEEHREAIGFREIEVNEQVAKVSIVGAGMVNNPGVAARMFEALYGASVNINMISTSEIKVSVLVNERGRRPGGPGHPRPLLQRIWRQRLNRRQSDAAPLMARSRAARGCPVFRFSPVFARKNPF